MLSDKGPGWPHRPIVLGLLETCRSRCFEGFRKPAEGGCTGGALLCEWSRANSAEYGYGWAMTPSSVRIGVQQPEPVQPFPQAMSLRCHQASCDTAETESASIVCPSHGMVHGGVTLSCRRRAAEFTPTGLISRIGFPRPFLDSVALFFPLYSLPFVSGS